MTVTVDVPQITLTQNWRVGSGLESAISFSLETPPGGAGVTVTLTSSNSGVVQLATASGAIGAGSITVNVGPTGSSGTFWVQGVEGQTATVTITAIASGYTNGTAAVTSAQTVFDLVGVPGSLAVGAADDVFQVRVGAGNAAGTGFFQEQNVRRSAIVDGMTLTVSNSNPARAHIETSGGPQQVATVRIPPGDARSPATVAAGGLALDGLSAGSTTLSGTAPGLSYVTPLAGATVTVNITP
jgi:hypothetical protein